MPLVRTALMATAACLIGATAYAQPASSDTSSAPMDNSQMSAPATTDQTAPAPADQAAANTSATVDNGTQVIASQPVPDTKANRAQYGQPLSRAGKRTAAAGN